jgi:hypothetical protein
VTTGTTPTPPRRDPKDTILQVAYILLFAIAGVTCVTGILFLRSGLRIAEPAISAASTTRVVTEPLPLAPPGAVSEDRGRLPVVHRVTMPEAPVATRKAGAPGDGTGTDADFLSVDVREPRMRTSGKETRR